MQNNKVDEEPYRKQEIPIPQTEYGFAYVSRTLEVHGKPEVICLPRYIWVSFDRIMASKVVTIERLLEMSQSGWEDRPDRSYQRNLEDYIQFLVYRLSWYL